MASMASAVSMDVLTRVGVALADDSRRRLLIALLDSPGYPSELAEQLDLPRQRLQPSQLSPRAAWSPHDLRGGSPLRTG